MLDGSQVRHKTRNQRLGDSSVVLFQRVFRPLLARASRMVVERA